MSSVSSTETVQSTGTQRQPSFAVQDPVQITHGPVHTVQSPSFTNALYYCY